MVSSKAPRRAPEGAKSAVPRLPAVAAPGACFSGIDKASQQRTDEQKSSHDELEVQEPVRAVLARAPPGVSCLDLSGRMHRLGQVGAVQLSIAAGKHITSLIICNWKPVDLIQLRTLALRIGPRISTLDLTGSDLTDAQLEAMAPQLHMVRTVKLRHCELLTSKGVRPLVQSCHGTLTCLDLSSCPNMGFEALLWLGGALAQSCPSASRLRTLDVSGCQLVVDAGLVGLGNGCTRLQELNLSECTGITSRGIEAISARVPHLRVLRLQGCAGVNDSALVALGRYCHHLRSLNVGRCGPLYDRGLEALGQGCPQLEALNVAGAKAITEAGLCKLVRGCPGLMTLNVTGCEDVTTNGLKALIQGLEYVQLSVTFQGFVPRGTAEVEKLEDAQAAVEEVAAIRLQNGLMKHFYRRWGRSYLFRLRMQRAASVIQRAFRRYVKRLVWWNVEQKTKTTSAALSLQRVWRGSRVRKSFLVLLRRQREYLQLGKHAVIIQTAYRGFKTRKREIKVLRAINDLYIERRQEVESAAAVYIQALVRGHIARRRYIALNELAAQRDRDMAAVAPKIQRAYRCYMARGHLHRLKKAEREYDERVNAAALKIQFAWYRYHGAAREKRARRLEAERREKQRRGAIQLQAAHRGWVVRKRLRQDIKTKVVQEKGSTAIQRLFRGTRVMRWERMRANKLACEVWDREDMEHDQAVRRVEELRPKLLAMIRVVERDSDSDDDYEGAENSWVEQWDEARQIRVWHNTMTGESSDDMPVSKHAIQLSLVGKFVRILWPVEQQWFAGTVVKYNRTKGKHKVEYEDGDREWVDLMKEEERVQIWEEETWVMLQYYAPPGLKAYYARRREREAKETAYEKAKREDAEWARLQDDEQAIAEASDSSLSGSLMIQTTTGKPKRVRMLNQTTGEVRLQARDADDWALIKHPEQGVAWYNSRTGKFVYDRNPRLEYFGALSDAELQKRKEAMMEEVYFSAYLVQALVEDYASATNDRQKLAFFRRLEQSPLVQRLAAAVASVKRLVGEAECADDDYVVYADDLLRTVAAYMSEKSELERKIDEVKRRFIDVERKDSTVMCSGCGRELPRTARHCPVCGLKLKAPAHFREQIMSSNVSSSDSPTDSWQDLQSPEVDEGTDL